MEVGTQANLDQLEYNSNILYESIMVINHSCVFSHAGKSLHPALTEHMPHSRPTVRCGE